MHKITARISAFPALNLRVLALIFIFAFAAVWPSIVGAAGDAFALEETQKNFASILSYVVKILTFLSFLMLDWAGHLFGTELVMGDTVREHLLPIWRLIRNYTNVMFVILLIYLALANMVSSFTGQGNWTIKEKLPRIILALIAINFSFLGMRLAIDAVNVGTTAIFSIADTSLKNFEIDKLKDIFERNVSKEGGGGMASCGSTSPNCKPFYKHMEDAFCPDGNIKSDRCLFKIDMSGLDPQQASKRNQTARNLTMSFGVFFQQLHKLPLLPAQIQGSWLAILENTLFSSLMAIMYVIALAAVFAAMMARVVVLWLATAFSPALLAMSIMGISAADEMNKKFVTHLIMPLKVAAAFTFSFILLSALSASELQTTGGSIIEMGPAIGQYFNNEYGFLWQMMTVAVFWTSAFWALQGSLAEKIVDGIKSGAERTGKFVAKAAILDRQVIPNFVGDGANATTSLSALMSAPRAFTDKYERNNRAAKEEDWRSWGLMDPGGDNKAKVTSAVADGVSRGLATQGERESGKWVDSIGTQGGLRGFSDNKDDYESIIDARVKDKKMSPEDGAAAKKILADVAKNPTQKGIVDLYNAMGLTTLASEVRNDKDFDSRYTKEGTGVAGAGGDNKSGSGDFSVDIDGDSNFKPIDATDLTQGVSFKLKEDNQTPVDLQFKKSADGKSYTLSQDGEEEIDAQKFNAVLVKKDKILEKMGLKDSHIMEKSSDGKTLKIIEDPNPPTS